MTCPHLWSIRKQAKDTSTLVEARPGDDEFVSRLKLVEPRTCPHSWHIRKQANNHDVGQCQLCGAWKDFTLIQRQDPGYRKVFMPPVKPVHIGNGPIGITSSRVLIQGKRLKR